ERHVPVARRTVDRDSSVHQPLAGLVNVINLVSEVAEVAAARIALLAPVIGELDLAALVSRNAEENKREATRLILHSPALLESQQLKKCNSGVRIGYADHR